MTNNTHAAQDTKEQWLQRVRDNKDELTGFIAQYHPASHKFQPQDMPITAHASEGACQLVRQYIAADPSEAAPIQRFTAAVEAGDVNAIYSLLDSAWFGVPESTSCWSIPGFSLAVDLMDDPPLEREA